MVPFSLYLQLLDLHAGRFGRKAIEILVADPSLMALRLLMFMENFSPLWLVALPLPYLVFLAHRHAPAAIRYPARIAENSRPSAHY